jgi:coenzyme PQQ precursor peptide PqqA
LAASLNGEPDGLGKPVIIEIACGAEINLYISAEL